MKPLSQFLTEGRFEKVTKMKIKSLQGMPDPDEEGYVWFHDKPIDMGGIEAAIEGISKNGEYLYISIPDGSDGVPVEMFSDKLLKKVVDTVRSLPDFKK